MRVKLYYNNNVVIRQGNFTVNRSGDKQPRKFEKWASAQYKIHSARFKRAGLKRSFKSTPKDFRDMLLSISQGGMQFKVCPYTNRTFGLQDGLCYRVQDRILHRDINVNEKKERNFFLQMYNCMLAKKVRCDRKRSRFTEEKNLDEAATSVIKWYTQEVKRDTKVPYAGGYMMLN